MVELKNTIIIPSVTSHLLGLFPHVGGHDNMKYQTGYNLGYIT